MHTHTNTHTHVSKHVPHAPAHEATCKPAAIPSPCQELFQPSPQLRLNTIHSTTTTTPRARYEQSNTSCLQPAAIMPRTITLHLCVQHQVPCSTSCRSTHEAEPAAVWHSYLIFPWEKIVTQKFTPYKRKRPPLENTNTCRTPPP
jgi:hypothetical protein